MFPIAHTAITSDMVKKMALNLNRLGIGKVTPVYSMSREEASYVLVEAPRKRLTEVMSTINLTVQDDVIPRSKM